MRPPHVGASRCRRERRGVGVDLGRGDPGDAHRRRQGRDRHRRGQGRRQGHGAAPRQGRRARSSSRSGSRSCWSRPAPSSTRSASRTSVSSATSSERDQIDAMVAQTVERVRPRRRPHQQRADVPAAGADRRGHRTRRRRLLHVGRQGHALGDASRVPAHAATGLGPHRQLRVVDGHHRRHAASRRTTRRRKRSARSRAPPRASGRSTASS